MWVSQYSRFSQASAIQSQNRQASLGSIGSAPGNENSPLIYSLTTTGRLGSVKQFENVILRTTAEGGLVKLKDVATIERDGQVRLWWDETPVDLFFDYVELHEAAARNRRVVPFEGVEIPVLGPVELATFKAMFDRTRDWADIEAMLGAETLDVDAVRANITALVGDEDGRLGRLADAVARADRG